MKIAIPIFGQRVSPRFDCAGSILIIVAEGDEVKSRQEVMFDGMAPHERINKLIELNVQAVICGGVDRWSVESIQAVDITIFGGVAGEIEDAVSAYLRGELTEGFGVGNGACGRGQGQGQGQGQGMGQGRGGGRRRGGGRGGRMR